MTIQPLAFKGSMLINGTKMELDEIDKEIYTKSHKDKNGFVKNFNYQTRVHDGGSSTTNRTILFTTEDEASNLQKYFRAQKQEFSIDRGNIPPLKIKSKLGLNGFISSGIFTMHDFYEQNIKRFLDLPTKVYSAEEVKTAIKKGLFDFAKLVIKTEK